MCFFQHGYVLSTAEPWTTAELQTLISAEKYKVVSPNLCFASQRSVAATKELQEQAGKKRWLESHYGEPRETATDSAGQDGDLYTLPGLPQALPIALARGQ